MSFWSQRRDEPTPDGETPRPTVAGNPARPVVPARTANKSPVQPTPSSQATKATLIAKGSTVVGEITGETQLLVHGTVKGDIRLASEVIVGNDGRVEGNIQASSIDIAGTVNGNVFCEGLLKVQTSGRLDGEVSYFDVDVDKGGQITGKVQQLKPGTKPPKAAVAAKSEAQKTVAEETAKSSSTNAAKEGDQKPSQNQSEGSGKMSGSSKTPGKNRPSHSSQRGQMAKKR